ncbi:MAG: glycosyltransferase family 4 protein, partial [Anaerolineales bacterium]
IHRRTSLNPRYWLKAEYGNLLMNYTRLHLADRIIYQSEFVRRRWEELSRPAHVPHRIIYNSVDLDDFTPDGIAQQTNGGRQRIMVVEGSFTGGHDIGLRLVLDLADGLQVKHGIPTEVSVAGRVPEDLQEKWNNYAQVPVEWLGIIPREQIPLWDRSAALLFSAELNPACPNAVIEALACGLPVLGYDTGSLSELVTPEAGKVVPYDGNPWKLELPGTDQLIDAAAEIIQNKDIYRAGARQRAEAAFDLDQMVAQYVEVLQSV